MTCDWVYYVKGGTLQQRLYNDLDAGIYTDITFVVGSAKKQRTFIAHRLVMAAENSELERICGSASREIAIPDVHPIGFENLIKYCYSVDIGFDNDLSIIKETYLVAEKFKVENLKLAVENHLIEIAKSGSVVELLKISVELKLPRLKERCLEIISCRFESVLMTEELISAPFEVIEIIPSLCVDKGIEFKICTLVTLLLWEGKHKRPEDLIRLLAMMKDEHVTLDTISSLKGKMEQLSNLKTKDVMSSFLTEFPFLVQSPSLESTNCSVNVAEASDSECGSLATDETDSAASTVTLVGTDTEVEDSEERLKAFQEEEAIVQGIESVKLNDVEEIEDGKEAFKKNCVERDQNEGTALVVEGWRELLDKNIVQQMQEIMLKDRKESSEINDGYEIVLQDSIKEIMKDTSSLLIKNVVDVSIKETEGQMSKAIEEVIKHASETMQGSFEVFRNSFDYMWAFIPDKPMA